MTLGDRIRKYRLLKGITQKQLGEDVGFKTSTADVRINQYETNKMSPKQDIRQKIADALDVDISALSDTNILSSEDVIQILFELESIIGLDIERNAEYTRLIIPNNCDSQLNSYLYAWYIQKKNSSNDSEAYLQYEKWKARFPKDINTYLAEQGEQLDTFYSSYMDRTAAIYSHIQKLSEFLLLIRKLFQNGIDITLGHKSYGVGDGSLIMTFNISQLFDTTKDAIQRTFAEYLHTINTLKAYGMPIYRELSVNESGAYVSYELRWSVLTAFKSTLSEVMDFERKKTTLSDFEKDQFEKRFASDLLKYDLDLKSELSSIKNSVK